MIPSQPVGQRPSYRLEQEFPNRLLDDFYFVGRVVPSSAAWRHMVRELREWLELTGRRAPERQV
jgi:hypothetical protein